MKIQKTIPQQMIDDARELYLKYSGKQHQNVEDEMRARGWRFYRQKFYTRRNSHGVTDGWPVQYGWREMLGLDKRRLRQKASANRNRFERWLISSFPEWRWGWKYQRHIYNALQRVTKGDCRRLMIFLPPRHGKSELVTVRYMAWRLLEDLNQNLIIASYNQRLADKFSRKIKRIVKNTPPSPALVTDEAPAKAGSAARIARSLQPLNTAAEWETTAGGVVRAVGVGGGIAGFGADLIVVDDPIRSRADAESASNRERVWEWFNDDIYTRIEPRASIVLIQTRWHEDDLAGRLLQEAANGGEKWEVVSLPAIAEADDPLGRREGAALCPQRYNIPALLKFKKKLGSYSFSALYQQRPVPAEGGQFKRAWFKNIIDIPPANLRWKRGYDLAVSLKTTADYTASFRVARDQKGNLYIADGFRKRIEYPDQRRYIIERMQAEASTEHCVEDALHGKAIIQDLRREPGINRFALRLVPVKGDKLTRALAWLNLAEEGKVILVRGPWIDDFLDEICRFPNGSHDDQLDAVSVAVSRLDRSYKALVGVNYI